MKEYKELGVWMDHSNAILMELYNHTIDSKKLMIKPVLHEENKAGDTHVIQKHSKEQHQHQAAFYKEISDIIKNYQDVLLFGPTDAKNELFNLLKADHSFDNTKIELRNTDKMAENKIYEFVVEHFR